MQSKLIRLKDDTLVEVTVSEGRAREISGGLANRVDASFGKVKAILESVCKPISETWQELNRDLSVESAEVQLGLSFESEGNLFITSAKTGANLTVKLTLKPKP